MKILNQTIAFFAIILCTINLHAQTNELEIEGNAKVTGLQDIGDRIVIADPIGVLYTAPLPLPGEVLVANPSGSPEWTSPELSRFWSLDGNDDTNQNIDFLGTIDTEDLVIKTNSQELLRFKSSGRIEISGPAPVNGAKFEIDLFSTPGARIAQSLSMLEGTNGFTGVYRLLQSDADDVHAAIAEYNILGGAASSTNYRFGLVNSFGPSDSHQIGVNNVFDHTGIYTVGPPPPPGPNYIKGVQNIFKDTMTNNVFYGFYNEFRDIYGLAYGSYDELKPEPASMQDVYGSYTSITANGGIRYGCFYDIPGQIDDSFAAVFNQGTVVANESGGDYDLRAESMVNTHALWLDADKDLVVFGSDTPDLSGDGANFAGTTINFAADFDNGSNHGTAIGIGSREFLLDGSTETNINNGFAPLLHDTYDLGYSTSERGWNDVYAQNFVTTSDLREKSNVQDLSYGLNEILKMRPISYKLNHDPQGETKLGLIAQEVLPLIKEVVKTHDYKMTDESVASFEKVELKRFGMKYQELIPVLIQAIKEQQVQLKKLQDLVKDQAEVIEMHNQRSVTIEEKMSQLQKSISQLER